MAEYLAFTDRNLLFLTVTVTCQDDYGCLFTRYSTGSGWLYSYTESFEVEVTPPGILLLQSQDFDDNVDPMQILTYGLGETFSGAVQAGGTSPSSFDVVEGGILNINFSLAPNSIPLSTQSADCTTSITLKKPDGSVHGAYDYSEGILEILAAYPTQGIWTMEIDRSACDSSADYEAVVMQVPNYGNLPGGVSPTDLTQYLRILTGFEPLNMGLDKDIYGDGKISPVEAIYLLQKFSNIR